MRKTLALAAFMAVAFNAGAQAPQNPKALIDAQKAAMAKLSRLDGVWRGPAWTAYAVTVITDCPYASARDLRGLDGAVTLLRSYKQLLDESVGRFAVPKLALTSYHHGRPECRSKIRDFLGICLPDRDVAP